MPNVLLRWLLAVSCGLSCLSTARAQNALGEDALFITVQSPITTGVLADVRNRIDLAERNLSRPVKKIIFDFNLNGKETALSEFGPSSDLANLIQGKHGVTTIALVTAGVSGHAVLPVLACQEIAVGRNARLGDIVLPGSDPLPSYMIEAYRHILGTFRKQYQAVVAKMYDRGVILVKGEKDGAIFYVDLRDRVKLEKEGVKIADPTPLTIGTQGSFDAVALKTLGLATVSAESRNDLVDLFSLSPNSLRYDPLNGRTPIAFRYVLQGPIDVSMREAVPRVIKDVARQKGNILFLVLECSGGDEMAAFDLANRLIELRSEPDPVLVVAVIPDRAPDTAAIVALGCGEIVMSRRKDAKDAEPAEAEFGDFDSLIGSAPKDRVELLKKSLKDLAAKQGYPELLLEGMVDRDIGIVRVHAKVDKNRRKLLTEEQFEAERATWESDGLVKPKGQLLKLSATKALELGLARYTTNSRDVGEVYALYGVEASKVQEATPSFLDRFANFLRMPSVTVLLVVIGFAGLILELKVPGTTFPGIIAALAFILVFWSQSQFTGQNAVLGALIFMLGLVLILLEVFVIPGFGFTGILGIFFMLGGIGLATFDRIPNSGEQWLTFGSRISQYMGALIGAMVIAFTIARYLPNIPYANRLMLQPPTDAPNESPELAEAAGLLGAIGTSATPLRPAGMAQFGDNYVDVVSEGDFINAGSRVQVIEVEGTRIVVKEV